MSRQMSRCGEESRSDWMVVGQERSLKRQMRQIVGESMPNRLNRMDNGKEDTLGKCRYSRRNVNI